MADEEYDGKMIWFVAGAAIGAAIALLYAPASGEETRRRLAEKTEGGRAALADSGREMFERGREMYDRGRKLADEAAELFERGKQLVEGTAAKVQNQGEQRGPQPEPQG